MMDGMIPSDAESAAAFHIGEGVEENAFSSIPSLVGVEATVVAASIDDFNPDEMEMNDVRVAMIGKQLSTMECFFLAFECAC